jgi:hypothetical protein
MLFIHVPCYTCLLLVTATGGAWAVFSPHINFIPPELPVGSVVAFMISADPKEAE